MTRRTDFFFVWAMLLNIFQDIDFDFFLEEAGTMKKSEYLNMFNDVIPGKTSPLY